MNSKILFLALLLTVTVQCPAKATESTTAQNKPLISPPDNTPQNANEGVGNISTFFCHTKFDKGIQSNVNLEIDFEKRMVNEIPALISPIEIQWIRISSRGLSFYYRLNRYSGYLQGGDMRVPNQMTGWCEKIRNR